MFPQNQNWNDGVQSQHLSQVSLQQVLRETSSLLEATSQQLGRQHNQEEKKTDDNSGRRDEEQKWPDQEEIQVNQGLYSNHFDKKENQNIGEDEEISINEQILISEDPQSDSAVQRQNCESLLADLKQVMALEELKQEDKNPFIEFIDIENIKEKYIDINKDISEPDFDLQFLTNLQVLGAGSFGKVNQMFNKGSRKFYAVKMALKNDSIIAQLKEVSILYYIARSQFSKKLLKMMNIAFLKNQKKKVPVMILEYGLGSLDEYLNFRKEKSLLLNEEEVYFIFFQLVKQILMLNSIGVVHRDIKKANVLLMSDGTLKLADFGLSQYVQPAPNEEMHFHKGGTMGFIPPEISSKTLVKGTTLDAFLIDLYAVGKVMKNLLKYVDFEPQNNLTNLIEELIQQNPSARLSKKLLQQLERTKKDTKLPIEQRNQSFVIVNIIKRFKKTKDPVQRLVYITDMIDLNLEKLKMEELLQEEISKIKKELQDFRESSLKKEQQSEEYEKLAQKLLKCGTAFFHLEQGKTALEFIQNALQIKEKMNLINDYHHLDGKILIAQIQVNLEDYTSALQNFKDSMNITDKVFGPNHPITYVSLSGIANIHYMQKEYKQGLDYLLKCYELLKNNFGDKNFPGELFSNIALYLQAQGFLTEALENYWKCIDLVVQSYGHKSKYLVDIYYNIGRCYHRQQNYEDSLEYFDKSHSLSIEVWGENHLYTALPLSEKGQVYNKMKYFDSALTAFKKALDIYITINHDWKDIAFIYNRIGDVYNQISDFGKAEEYALMGLRLRTEKNSQAGIAESQHNLGLICFKQKEFQKAFKFFSTALNIVLSLPQDIDREVKLAICYTDMGGCCFQLQNFLQSFVYYKKAYELYINLEQDVEESKLRMYYALVYIMRM